MSEVAIHPWVDMYLSTVHLVLKKTLETRGGCVLHSALGAKRTLEAMGEGYASFQSALGVKRALGAKRVAIHCARGYLVFT